MTMSSSGSLASARDELLCGHRRLSLRRPAIMGVLNVTPDSFSDGGRYTELDAALARAEVMIEEGAAIVDIGGESTRPGATPVATEQELSRVLPVVEALRAVRPDIFISLDTSNPVVMRAGAAAGCDMINDVRGLEAPGALAAIADTGMAVCVMHHRGEPPTMQKSPRYDDVVAEVRGYLSERVAVCHRAGVDLARIVVDPGFGFGKTLAHNLALMRALGSLSVDGCPVLMGASRKSMFARLFERDTMDSRITGSLGAAFWAASRGIGMIRCHDVRATAEMVRLAAALVGDLESR